VYVTNRTNNWALRLLMGLCQYNQVSELFALYIRGGGSPQSNRSAMWQCYEKSMQRHIRMHMVSTYFNIDGVEKKPDATWKRARKKALTPKQNLTHKPLCGSLKNSPSRKERLIIFGNRTACRTKMQPTTTQHKHRTQNRRLCYLPKKKLL
jgi:hypothetical protein